jgi:hypothetical protein
MVIVFAVVFFLAGALRASASLPSPFEVMLAGARFVSELCGTVLAADAMGFAFLKSCV